jgi:4-diphosphocytidyl-2-C-methyl-D-erythritol kinase
MVVFPNAKINLGLNIIRKREDGYHDLETVFYPLMIKDCLEVIQSIDHRPQTTATKTMDNGLSTVDFSSTGLEVAGNENDNLCIKAYQLLKKDFPSIPNIKMHLHKTIPMGAGLGGGSADGAFMLKLLNEKFNLNLSTRQLIDYALQLGSDCPFFIINQPCFASSRGEVMEAIDLVLRDYSFVIVNPKIHVATSWAFSNIVPSVPKKSIKEIIQQPIETWKDELINDFEEPVSKQHVEIKNIKQELYNKNAVYAAMSGSGSTAFGLFDKNSVPTFSFPDNYFVQTI